ncbi:MAG: hypothetical protein JWQ98_2119 [Chlorobi bacterium]|jgi:hypothetical protein|nr:hypothetical protein [Chlorobiota bacterium]
MKPGILLPLLLAAALSGCTICNGDAMVAPVSQEYSGSNGYVIHRISGPHVTVDCEKSSVEFADAFGLQRAIRLDIGKLDGKPMILLLALPGNSTSEGDFKWVPSEKSSPTNAYLTIGDGEEVVYSSKGGMTQIEKFGSIGEYVSGSFSGTIEDSEHHELAIDGRFKAVRVE